MRIPKKQEETPKGSPSASKSGRFPKDQFLRSREWVIYSRPKRGPVLWRYRDVIATEEEALEMEQFAKEEKRRKVTKDD